MQIARRDILKLMRENRQTRVRMILNCEMTRKELFSESTQILNTFFHSETVENLEGTDESAVFDRSIQTIEERIQNFNQRGSNWRFQRVISLDILFTDFQPLRGSTFLPLPSKISTKKAVINMKNNDDQCFKWSVVRALHPVDIHPERITKELKDQSERLDWSGLKFPVKLDQIVIFEKFNPSISINIFGFEGVVYPLRLSKRKNEQTINLLLISDGEKQHYCLIKSLSRLLSSQVSGHKESNSFCLNCLNHFPNEEKLKIHEEYCLKNQAIRIEMPEEGSLVTFIHHRDPLKFLLLFMLISKHLRKRFLRANQTIKNVLHRNIKNTNRVDFASRLSALMKDTIKNQFSSERGVKMKMSVQFSLKCLSVISRGFKKNLISQKR